MQVSYFQFLSSNFHKEISQFNEFILGKPIFFHIQFEDKNLLFFILLKTAFTLYLKQPSPFAAGSLVKAILWLPREPRFLFRKLRMYIFCFLFFVAVVNVFCIVGLLHRCTYYCSMVFSCCRLLSIFFFLATSFLHFVCALSCFINHFTRAFS